MPIIPWKYGYHGNMRHKYNILMSFSKTLTLKILTSRVQYLTSYQAFSQEFCQAQGQVFVKMGVGVGGGRNLFPCSKIFAIFMFATSKSTIFKSLHKQKRYQINVTF
jgi:hypothetical protein